MFFEGYMGDSPKDKQIDEPKIAEGLLDRELPDPDDVETYTVQQVMHILNISRTTVYSLVNRGYIEAKEYLVNSRTRKLFTQASVDAYKQKLESLITVKKVAEQHGLTVGHIFQLLNKHDIPYEVNEQEFTRPTAVLSPEAYQAILKVVKEVQESQNLNRRSTFIYKGYGLHQPFKDSDGNIVRLVAHNSEHRKMWGFFFQGDFIPLETALKEGFNPVYQLKTQQKATKQQYYATFECKTFMPEAMEWIDYVYTHVGVKDLYIRQLDNNTLQIKVKAGEYSFDENQFDYLNLQWLINSVIEGNVEEGESEQSITIHGKYRAQTYHLLLPTYYKIEELAATAGCTQSEIIERAFALYAEQVEIKKS